MCATHLPADVWRMHLPAAKSAIKPAHTCQGHTHAGRLAFVQILAIPSSLPVTLANSFALHVEGIKSLNRSAEGISSGQAGRQAGIRLHFCRLSVLQLKVLLSSLFGTFNLSKYTMVCPTLGASTYAPRWAPFSTFSSLPHVGRQSSLACTEEINENTA